MRDTPDDARRLSNATPAQRSVLIFAGGRATRLGGVNKALLEVGGQRIIDRIVGALGGLALEHLVLSNDASLGDLPRLRVIHDPEPHAGVLPALGAGLAAATGEVCLTVACDMPFVSRAVFEYLLALQRQSGADVVIPRSEGQLEPMHAVYRRASVVAAIEAALARGEQRMISYFSAVQVLEVDAAEMRSLDPRGMAFMNVNTPEDLARACELADATAA